MSPSKYHTYMIRSVKGGLLYFVGVFALGFAFGGIRLMLLVPTVGELWAVSIEVPIMLGISWLLCARVIVIQNVGGLWQDRIVMGLTALLFLVIAEFLLWFTLCGNSPATFIDRYFTTAGLIGLFGQLIFASFPMVQKRANLIEH